MAQFPITAFFDPHKSFSYQWIEYLLPDNIKDVLFILKTITYSELWSTDNLSNEMSNKTKHILTSKKRSISQQQSWQCHAHQQSTSRFSIFGCDSIPISPDVRLFNLFNDKYTSELRMCVFHRWQDYEYIPRGGNWKM